MPCNLNVSWVEVLLIFKLPVVSKDPQISRGAVLVLYLQQSLYFIFVKLGSNLVLKRGHNNYLISRLAIPMETT